MSYEIFETFLSSNKKDSKGRVFGYSVELKQWKHLFLARVHKCIELERGDWTKWGATQNYKEFNTAEQARDWAYATAKERLAKI